MDYAALPPEVNSGLMYAGPGSGPLISAAAAWDELAATLYATASSYGSLVADVTTSWLGPASNSMAAAATPYVSWLSTVAGQAETTGVQAKAAVSAYEAAFAMTVPPPVIAANRTLLAALVATNFFGQNTPAIAATEALYAEMWAQDAAAMYGYAGASAAASILVPFLNPPRTTNESGTSGQAAAVAHVVSNSAGSTSAQTVSQATSAASTPLTSGLSTPLTTSGSLTSAAASDSASGVASTAGATAATSTSTTSTSTLSSLTSSTTAVTSASSVASGTSSTATMGTTGMTLLGSANTLMKSITPAASALSSQMQVWGSTLSGSTGIGSVGNAAVNASVGRAATLSVLSVPQNWTTAAPAFSQFSQVSSVLPTTGANAVPAVAASNPGVFSPPLATLAGRESTPVISTPRFDVRPTVVQRPVAAG